MEVDLGPGDFVIDGDSTPPSLKREQFPSFRFVSIVATFAHVSCCWALI